jgi:hypothetical protein
MQNRFTKKEYYLNMIYAMLGKCYESNDKEGMQDMLECLETVKAWDEDSLKRFCG